MTLTPGLWTGMRDMVVARNDHDIARTFRERNGPEVAHLSDDDLTSAVAEAREAAVAYGITDPRLRMRFIMLGVLRLPRFWMDETLDDLLTAPTGTPDMRFGDLCAMVRLSAQRAGMPNHVWWS